MTTNRVTRIHSNEQKPFSINFIHVWIGKFACICQVSKAFRMGKSTGMFTLWVYFAKNNPGIP